MRPVVLLLLLIALPLFAAEPIPIIIDVQKPLHSFDPTVAFGATIDAHSSGDNEQIFTNANIRAIRSAGFHRLSYRLMTELAGEAWHWNPRGTWSDEENAQGYWTSSTDTAAPIALSYGYRLPRRGNTRDQSRNSDYSRIDDGDLSTFWKSNPYLDEHFAGEAHPQWILVDLGVPSPVDAVKIAWETPFAVDYRVQYWRGSDAIRFPQETPWTDFEDGIVSGARGGAVTLRVSRQPVATRYVRILMTRSSHTSASVSNDFRDRAGYAVRELSIGTLSGSRFLDRMRHGKGQQSQTLIWVSSTDPWHRAIDRDADIEQLGFDALFATGLAGNRPALMPVALLYGTPEDGAAEVAYLRKRGFLVDEIELGEEPDGQQIVPEDYAALYRQWARAIHAVNPALRLGGPALQSTVDTTGTWPDASGNTSWVGRFVNDLRKHGQLADFNFFSFEWYPFDNLCESPQKQIVRAPSMLMPVIRNWVKGGLPENIPWLVTEYGYSSYAGKPEVDLTGAIFDAEFVAQYLSAGGTAAYFYGVEPDILISEATSCGTWGNLLLFLSDEQHRIRYKLPAYQAARLLTKHWTEAAGGEHTMFETDVRENGGVVTAYCIHRPDDRWSVIVFNKSDRAAANVLVQFRSGQRQAPLRGEVEIAQYSSKQYAWHAAGAAGRPTLDLPIVERSASGASSIELPPYSITVVTGAR